MPGLGGRVKTAPPDRAGAREPKLTRSGWADALPSPAGTVTDEGLPIGTVTEEGLPIGTVTDEGLFMMPPLTLSPLRHSHNSTTPGQGWRTTRAI